MFYTHVLEAELEKIIERNERVGTEIPFLHTKSGRLLAARLIPTKRDESLNVCWAFVRPSGSESIAPNGIFLSANEAEWGSLDEFIEARLVRIFVSDIRIEMSPTPSFNILPQERELRKFFDENNALWVKDKTMLTSGVF